jgi:hypothetical protein
LETASPPERRVWTRYPCDLRVSCNPYLGEGLVLRAGRARDISRGGIGLELGEAFPPGTSLNIWVRKMPAHDSRLLWAQVVRLNGRTGGRTVGCRFTNELSDDDLAELLREDATS